MGGTTASGEKVTETSMGIAMLNVPLGTRVEIRYGGRSVIAYVNDRGPYAHGRVIDMQPAVARALNFVSVGVGTVAIPFPVRGAGHESTARALVHLKRSPHRANLFCGQHVPAARIHEAHLVSYQTRQFHLQYAVPLLLLRRRGGASRDAKHGIMDAATYQAIVDRAFTRVLDAIAARPTGGRGLHHPHRPSPTSSPITRKKLYRFYKAA